MDSYTGENSAHLAGRVLTAPAFNHKTYGEAFYLVVLGIFRRSGCEDRIRLIVSERILGARSPREGELLDVTGQVRTYNREADGRSHLDVTVFVREMEYCEGEEFLYCNEISIAGYLCKPPVRRTSPLGREICDLMVAVNRLYHKSDYIPSIAWGRNALYAEQLAVGDKVVLGGRLQSREYRKYAEDGSVSVRTAYELSVGRMEVLE